MLMMVTDEQVVCCRLSSLQSSLYKSLVNSKSTQNALTKMNSGKIAASSLSAIMHLKKLCNRTLHTLTHLYSPKSVAHNIHCVSKKLHPFYFCNNFVDPGFICIIFGSDTPEENCNKTCIVFPTTPIFCAPTVPCKTSNKSD